jgi:hypothetical protein
MPRIASPQLVPAATPQQPGPTDFDQTVGMPPYAFRTYQFAADESGKVRVEVYLGLVNDILQFVKVATDTGDLTLFFKNKGRSGLSRAIRSQCDDLG